MLYVALTFWLLVVILAASGVHRLLSGIVRPKVLNTILLPGTLVAQIGHVLGLLVTGATVNQTTLYDESGAPETTPNPKSRIPIIGPIVIGLLPMLSCATAIFFVARYLGASVIGGMRVDSVGPSLPTTVPALWQLLRDQITLVESWVSAIAASDLTDWRTWLFLYLLTCLTIRLAPFPGCLRGALGAILVLGIATAAATSLLDVADPRVRSGWAILSLCVASVLLLLLATLLTRGGVALAKLLAGRE